jgi:hypothetical protein
MRIVSWLAAGALVLAAGCASTESSSSTGTATAPHPATAAAPMANASGSIQNYTTGPSGAQNGFVMASGQRVHFPEEMAAKVSDQFPPNTQVTVQGHTITDADGRSVIEADKITAPDRNATIDLTAARAAPPSPATGPSVGGSGTAGSQPVNPPSETQPGTIGNPPPGGR